MGKFENFFISSLLFFGMWFLVGSMMYHLPLSINKNALNFNFWVMFFWITGLLFVILGLILNYRNKLKGCQKSIEKYFWNYIVEIFKFVGTVLFGIVIYALAKGLPNGEIPLLYVILVFITGFILYLVGVWAEKK